MKPSYALIRDSGFIATAKAILWALDSRHGRNMAIFPSIKQLALDAGLGRQAVSDWVGLLKDADVLTVERGHTRRSNRYSINFGEMLSADERMSLRTTPSAAVDDISVAVDGTKDQRSINEESELRNANPSHRGMDSDGQSNLRKDGHSGTVSTKENEKPRSHSKIEDTMERVSAVLTKIWKGQAPTEGQLGLLAMWASAHSPEWVLDTLGRRPKGSDPIQFLKAEHLASEEAIGEVRQADLPVVQKLADIWGRPPTKKELRRAKYIASQYQRNGMAQIADQLGDMSPDDNLEFFLWGKYREYVAGPGGRVAP
jgi:hypothetical protein